MVLGFSFGGTAELGDAPAGESPPNAQANGKKLGRPKSAVDRKRILELKAQGHSLRQIATKLGVGYGTVRARLLALHKI
jgi:DNA invertase Pin-like site-specific DNA recombinase